MNDVETMRRVRVADDPCFPRSDTRRRTVAGFHLWRLVSVKFNKLPVVNLRPECTFNRFDVGAQAVARQLHATG